MAASIIWSYYPSATAVGLLTTGATAFIGIVMAHTLSLEQLLRGLGVALRFIIGLGRVHLSCRARQAARRRHRRAR